MCSLLGVLIGVKTHADSVLFKLKDMRVRVDKYECLKKIWDSYAHIWSFLYELWVKFTRFFEKIWVNFMSKYEKILKILWVLRWKLN